MRRQLSDILLVAYVQQLLVHRSARDSNDTPHASTDDDKTVGAASSLQQPPPSSSSSPDAVADDLGAFLCTNTAYSTALATRLLLDASALDLLLEMARVRGDVRGVLTLAVSEKALKFPPAAIDKVLARGLGDEICEFDGGLLLQ